MILSSDMINSKRMLNVHHKMLFSRFTTFNQSKQEGKQYRVPLSEIQNDVPKYQTHQSQKPAEHPVIPHIIDERPPYEPLIHDEFPIGSLDDPQDVAEYEHIIYRSMREQELHSQCSLPSEVSLSDRGILIDHLCRLHYKCQLNTLTFYRCVGILDRLTSVTPVSGYNYYIFGYAAMLVASKFEDVSPLRIEDAITISDVKFSRDDMKKAEIMILNLINFDLTFPTPLFFLNIFLRINGQTKEIMLLSRYLCEICMSSEEFFNVKASAIAASAIMMMRTLLNLEPWPNELAGYTRYSFADLCKHVKSIHRMLLEPNRPQTAFMRKKYSSEPFCRVAKIPIPLELPIPYPYYE